MIRVVIFDQGKALTPKDLTSPAQLRAALDQARALVAECEQLLSPKPDKGPAKPGGMPYLS